MAKEDILERDELLALEDEASEKKEQAALLNNKQKNYAMLRNLHLLPNADGLGAHQFMELFFDGPDGFEKFKGRIMQFQHWKLVEGGQVQIRESSDRNDDHGYAVVRSDDDLVHDLFLRVWYGSINSAVILPRRDTPLPRQGKEKVEILRKMELPPVEQINGYKVWLQRMKKVNVI